MSEKKVDKKFIEEHLLYEFQMLIFTYKMNIPSQIGENIRIDLFLLHARNLIEFFYIKDPGNPEYEYARAFEFVKGPDAWESEFSREALFYKNHYHLMCAHATHLTHKRYYGEDPRKAWDFDLIKIKLVEVLITFIKKLPLEWQDSVKSKFKEIIESNNAKLIAGSFGDGSNNMPINGMTNIDLGELKARTSIKTSENQK